MTHFNWRLRSDVSILTEKWSEFLKVSSHNNTKKTKKQPKTQQLCSAEAETYFWKFDHRDVMMVVVHLKLLQIKPMFSPVDGEVGLKRTREAFLLFLLVGGVKLRLSGVQRPHLPPELQQRRCSSGSPRGQWQVPAASWCHRRKNKNKQSCS